MGGCQGEGTTGLERLGAQLTVPAGEDLVLCSLPGGLPVPVTTATLSHFADQAGAEESVCSLNSTDYSLQLSTPGVSIRT